MENSTRTTFVKGLGTALLPRVLLLVGTLCPCFGLTASGQTRSDAALLPEVGSRITRFAAQIPAGQVSRVGPTLGDLLNAARATKADIVVASSADGKRLREALQARHAGVGQRVTIVRSPRVYSAWARDRFIAAKGAQGPLLLHQPRGTRLSGDLRLPHTLAKSTGRYKLKALPCYLEGGDLLVGERVVLLGPRSLAMAVDQSGVEAGTLIERLDRFFGKAVVPVDVARSQSPEKEDLEHHLDMTVALLADDIVLLADPAAGAALLEKDYGAEYTRRVDESTKRLRSIRSTLERAGLTVRSSPALLVPRESSVLTYVNVLQETMNDRRIVYLPEYGWAALDRAAAKAYKRLGYEVQAIDVSRVYRFGGSLRCLVNVTQRD